MRTPRSAAGPGPQVRAAPPPPTEGGQPWLGGPRVGRKRPRRLGQKPRDLFAVAFRSHSPASKTGWRVPLETESSTRKRTSATGGNTGGPAAGRQRPGGTRTQTTWEAQRRRTHTGAASGGHTLAAHTKGRRPHGSTAGRPRDPREPPPGGRARPAPPPAARTRPLAGRAALQPRQSQAQLGRRGRRGRAGCGGAAGGTPAARGPRLVPGVPAGPGRPDLGGGAPARPPARPALRARVPGVSPPPRGSRAEPGVRRRRPGSRPPRSRLPAPAPPRLTAPRAAARAAAAAAPHAPPPAAAPPPSWPRSEVTSVGARTLRAVAEAPEAPGGPRPDALPPRGPVWPSCLNGPRRARPDDRRRGPRAAAPDGNPRARTARPDGPEGLRFGATERPRESAASPKRRRGSEADASQRILHPVSSLARLQRTG